MLFLEALELMKKKKKWISKSKGKRCKRRKILTNKICIDMSIFTSRSKFSRPDVA